VGQSLNRFAARAAAANVRWRREAVPPGEVGGGAIRHFERALFSYSQRAYRGDASAVVCRVAPDPRREAEACAAQIRLLVTQRGYRYRQIAVACQDLTKYRDALVTAFALYDVPVFLAESRPADRHALSTCVLSALRLVVENWKAEDMEILLRTGYLPLTDDEADRLALYMREKGLRGARLHAPRRDETDADACAAEAAREKAVAPLVQLSDALRASRDTKRRLTAVYEFLESIGARERIEAERAFLIGEGQLSWAAEGEQVYARVVGALDQILDIAPERTSLADLLALMEQALAATETRMLPQSGDAVAAGGADHMKSAQVRALFLLGMADQQDCPGDGLLSDADERLFATAGKPLWRLSQRDRSCMQKLSVKALLSLTHDFLYMSCPLSDERGETRRPGALMQTAAKLLGVPIDTCPRASDGAFSARDAALANLPGALREDPDDPCALRAARAVWGLEGGRAEIKRLIGALTFRIRPDALPPELALRAYGDLAQVSVSQLERFAQCPFRYFARYALRPVPPRTFEVSPADAGTFFHGAIEAFSLISAPERLTGDEAARRMDEISDALLERTLSRALSAGAVARAEAENLKSVARRAARALVAQRRGGLFEPLGAEVEFGKSGQLLRVGDAVLAGRIDRIDRFFADGEQFLRVIDYKTGGKRVSLSEVYHGLQLQLTLYLAAAMQALHGRPAGAFYFAVVDPLVKTDERDAALVESLRAKALRMDGLVLRDERVVRAMAGEPEEALKVRFKGDGTLYADPKVIDEASFRRLMARSTDMARAHLSGIRAGVTAAEPARGKAIDSCAYCEYAAACQWDESLPGGRARQFQTLSGAKVLQKLADEAAPADSTSNLT
jgi:ATP-dependent helicase/nuclease subunit B